MKNVKLTDVIRKRIWSFRICVDGLRDEPHFGVIVRVGAQPEAADLGVEGEPGEVHLTVERDPGGLAVEERLVRAHPHPRHRGQNLHHLKRLQIVNVNIWQPNILNYLRINRSWNNEQ